MFIDGPNRGFIGDPYDPTPWDECDCDNRCPDCGKKKVKKYPYWGRNRIYMSGRRQTYTSSPIRV